MPSPSSRRIRWIPVALLVVALAAIAWHFLRGNGDDEASRQRPQVRVERGTVENTVTALGSLQPKEYVDVGTQVSGQLRRMHVDIGDEVEQGQLIAEIDPTVYEARLRKDEANLDNLEAQKARQQAELRLAELRLERNRRLLGSNAVSKEAVDEQEANVAMLQAGIRATEAQIRSARATVEEDRANLGYTRIYAPMKGTVVSRSAVEGQTVNATQTAPEIVRIADLGTMTVWAEVAEADVNRIRPGMPAYFTTLGMPDRRFEGIVRQIQPTPEIVNDVVLYKALIDVANEERLLLPDMTVQVFFVLEHAENVPVVPLAALVPVPGERGRYQAEVLVGERIEKRTVEIGIANRSEAEVRSGLKEGDVVLMPAAAMAAADARRTPRFGARL